jgi:hypothetical protein
MPPMDYTKKNLEQACTDVLIRCGTTRPSVDLIRGALPLPGFLKFTCETAYVHDLDHNVLVREQLLIRNAARRLADSGQFDFKEEPEDT